MTAIDGRTELKMLSFQAPKIRLLRSLSIENEAMQVLDFAAFARPEFDVPIFCANFFTAASMNIIVLDLNPLHNVIDRSDYKEKYYESLLPVGLKYAELFPWGGKLTSESLQFFSPIVIWTKFTKSQYRHDDLYSAFVDYYKAWLQLVDLAVEEKDVSHIICNCEAQHKYLTWREQKSPFPALGQLVVELYIPSVQPTKYWRTLTDKVKENAIFLFDGLFMEHDPGHGVLKRLIGESLAKDVIKNFLFNGIDELGSKGFLDYFPEYRCNDGNINENRSIIGKSFEYRPWDAKGEFIGNNIRI
ncbi:hypothetical protein GH714_026718 [Hevea brasiliensis]|uniref:Phytochromobilin:ferredoxin oxidoreductase, chloroplastic n=1 Tax=Hevea brasiliensis TaxID=3981 RepID=A0A6A6MFU3_HEVBR|nr:hypothetical protein GH714_026718 [Hevea brasiliensis]